MTPPNASLLDASGAPHIATRGDLHQSKEQPYRAPRMIRLRIVFRDVGDGLTLALCRDWPGVHAQGGSEDEALAALREVAKAVIETYEDLKDIPWSDATDDDDKPGPQIQLDV